MPNSLPQLSGALRGVRSAIKKLRDALPVQSIRAQDVAAEEVLRAAVELLPLSERMNAAFKAGLARPGNAEIDDERALVEMACLIGGSRETKRPKTAAREVCADVRGNSEASTVRRLCRKYRARERRYLNRAAPVLLQRSFTKHFEPLFGAGTRPWIELTREFTKRLESLAERLEESARTEEIIGRLAEHTGDSYGTEPVQKRDPGALQRSMTSEKPGSTGSRGQF